MSSFTSEADRNCVVTFCCSVNKPVWRSKTAMPAVTPGGTATVAEATGDEVAGDGSAADEADGDGTAAGVVMDRVVEVAGALPHALTSITATTHSMRRPLSVIGWQAARCW